MRRSSPSATASALLSHRINLTEKARRVFCQVPTKTQEGKTSHKYSTRLVRDEPSVAVDSVGASSTGSLEEKPAATEQSALISLNVLIA